MRAELEKRPGVEYNFSQPIKDRVEESISGIRGQVVVKIYGEDLNLMHEKLEEIRRILDQTRGSRDVEIYRAGTAQHIVADIDREAISRYGLQVQDVEDVVESGFGGQLATDVWEGERRVGVRVKLPVAEEGDANVLGRLDIPVSDDGSAPAARLARQGPRRHRAARRSTASKAAGSSRSSATSRGATWARSSRRPSRAPSARSSCPRATSSRGAASSRTSGAP